MTTTNPIATRPRELLSADDARATREAWAEIREDALRAQRFDWAAAGLVLGFLLGALFATLIGGGS